MATPKSEPKTESQSEIAIDEVIYVDSKPAEIIETIVYADPIVKAEPVKESKKEEPAEKSDDLDFDDLFSVFRK